MLQLHRLERKQQKKYSNPLRSSLENHTRSLTKLGKRIPVFRPKRRKNPARWGCRNLYSLYKEASLSRVTVFLPGPSRRLAPVLKCRRFLSFFQLYIVRDISLTEIYRWLIEILSSILKRTRHGGQSRERL